MPTAKRMQLLRRAADLIEERVYDIAAALTLEVGKNRMEALGEAQETRGLLHRVLRRIRDGSDFDHALPDDPMSGLRVATTAA